MFTLTYKDILSRMLERISGKFDKREGSVIYDALSPSAYENEQMYESLNTILENAFADTADRDHLVRRAAEVGITPHNPTAAVWSAKLLPINLTFDAGIRFSCGTMNLILTASLGSGLYELTCEDTGTSGNALSETLLPISYNANLQSATLVSLVTEGTDVETTDHLRERLIAYLQKPATSGNKQDYYNWAMSISGVGAAKVFPLANGAGTVKVVIADADLGAASEDLISNVSTYIESVRPIGAAVSVISVTECAVNISAHVTIKSGYKIDTVQTSFLQLATEYLNDIAFQSGEVKITKIGSLLLNVTGVTDYTDLGLNGGSANIVLSNEQVAKVGTVKLEAQIDG